MHLEKKLSRFAATGLLVTGTHVLITVLFMNYALPSPSLANGIAFVTATALSYFINTLWSFSAPLGMANLSRFLAVSLVGLSLASGIAALAEYHHLHYARGLLMVILVVPLATFLLHHFWTYNDAGPGED